VTTTIITDENGVRYRHDDEIPCHRCDDPTKPFHSIGSCRKSKVLPRVPDWPLPGSAPQFIGDDDMCDVRDGDLVIRLYNGRFEIYSFRACHDAPGVSELLCEYGKAWLIARADRTADA